MPPRRLADRPRVAKARTYALRRMPSDRWWADGRHVAAVAHRAELVLVETDSGRTIARSIKRADGTSL